LVEAGTISREEAETHRFRAVSWKHLGSKEVGAGPDVLEVRFEPDDRFLLCTDGLTGAVSNDAILGFMKANPEAQLCAEGLGKLALDAGSRDNVSCIVVNCSAGKALEIGRCTLLGNHREEMKDAIDVRRGNAWTVCAVADGWGCQHITGPAVGGPAERAVNALLHELGGRLPAAENSSSVKESIRAAVLQANEEVMTMSVQTDSCTPLCSTIVLLAWRRGSSVVFVTNVGLSRCYHIQVQQPPASLAPVAYRDRARRLADDLTRQPAADDADRLHQLGVLAVKLAELVADLHSVGVPEDDYRPLVRLLADLRALTASTDAPAARVSQMTVAATQVLREFAGPATPECEEAFWK
jgi:serine/threonine protein phosphatase PrpC